jgi:uncharacterized protein (TIGR00369 family)
MSIMEQISAWMASGQSMPVCRLIGMTVDSATPGASSCSLAAASEHFNPFGTVHGGILCDLADLSMGMAFMTTLNPGESLATIELKINYVRPAREGKLTATSRVVHRGRSTGLIECDITDVSGRLIARASSTCMVVKDDRVLTWNPKES